MPKGKSGLFLKQRMLQGLQQSLQGLQTFKEKTAYQFTFEHYLYL